MSTESENVTKVVETVSKIADAIDIFARLQKSFTLSKETIVEAEQCQEKIAALNFKDFDEKYSRKTSKQIPTDRFEEFVDKQQKRFNLPDYVKDSMLDGLVAVENEEKIKHFHFKDGEGDIHHGRFVTIKRNGKMDLAYAIYTLSFQLAEKERIDGSYNWWFGVLPVWSATLTKEACNLSNCQKDIFSRWCEVKLYRSVVQEDLKE